MTTATVPHPPIVSREQWLAERKKLLEDEKELTRHYDRVNAGRRRLPMVKIDKDYLFDGPNGKQNLKALFEGRRQLIVYHFMFDPAWDKGSPGCMGFPECRWDRRDGSRLSDGLRYCSCGRACSRHRASRSQAGQRDGHR